MRLFSKIENSKDITDKEYVDALISSKANLSGGNTFTGTQTLNNPSSGGYSINAAGYIKGSWLQSSATSNKGANTGKVCVFDDAGWVYYRTPKEVIIDAECAVKYEVKKTIDFGNSGALYIGKFNVYDTNVTCEVTSTTSVTYSGKLVIATQNYVIMEATVYGDAANTVAPNFFIKPSSTSDPYIEVYFKPTSWSKNVVHIYGSAITAEPTNVCTNVSSVPSTATLKPTNALDNVSKHGYTQLTNEDLNTIIEPGWYNAAVGNSCTNKPSAIGTLSFYLTVEAVPGALRQTLYEPSWYDRWYARYYSGGWTGWNLQYSVNTSTQIFSGSKTFGNGINLTGALRVGGSAGTSGQVLTSTGTGTPQWTTLSNNVMTGEPEVNGASYTVFDSGEFGSFIGVFNTEAPSTSFQITVGRAVYTISSNEQAVAYRLTIDKGEDNVYSTIAVSGGTVDKSSDFGLIPTDGVVSISTNLESSYVESNKCVTIWG